jgi:nucleotide-binding universal stress UspA family protein
MTGPISDREQRSQDPPILICYEGSADAERAVDAAAELFGPRPAVVLTVAPPITFAEAAAATSSVIPATAFEDLNKADALQLARAGVGYALRAGLEAHPRVEMSSTTWRAIVDVADEMDAAAIVIGSRGLRALRELAGTSVSHDVATHARRPVLIVPPQSRAPSSRKKST